MLDKIAGYLKLSNFLWFSLVWTVLLFSVDTDFRLPLAEIGIVITSLYYLFWLCYGVLWLHRKINSFWRCFRAEGFKRAWGKQFKPLSAEETSRNIWAIRGFWLAVGFVLLVSAIKETPSVAIIAFVVGLMSVALMCRPPENKHERAAIMGRVVFVLALTAYVFYGFDGNAGLAGWGAGLICGYATFFDEDHAFWRTPYRRDRWQLLKAELLVIAKKLSRLGGKP